MRRPVIVTVLILALSQISVAGEPNGSFEKPKKLRPRRTQLPADAPPICDLKVKQPKLAPGNKYRCRGIPFEFTFPKAFQFEQHWGNGWLCWQYSPTGRVILVSVQAAPWTLYEKRWIEVDNYLPRLLKSLAGIITPEIGTPETVTIPGADFARKVGFSAGDNKTGTAGVNLSVISKGWLMQLMVTGKKGHPLRRGGEYFKKIMSSVKVVPRTAPMLHKFRNGATVELPHDSWILQEKDQRGRPNPTYMTASDMTIIRIIEVQSHKPCDQLTKSDWKKMIGDLTNQPGQKGKVVFGYTFFFDLAGIGGSWANAEVLAQFPQETGRQRDPAIAFLICHKNNLVQMFAIATRSTRRHHRQLIHDILTSYQGPGD